MSTSSRWITWSLLALLTISALAVAAPPTGPARSASDTTISAEGALFYGPIISTDPKGAYDVVMYQWNATTYARTANGTLILSDTNDTTVLRAAMDYARNASLKDVVIANGSYTLDPSQDGQDSTGASAYNGWRVGYTIDYNVSVRCTGSARLNYATNITLASNKGAALFLVNAPGKEVSISGCYFDANKGQITVSYSPLVFHYASRVLRIENNHIEDTAHSFWGDNKPSLAVEDKSHVYIRGNYLNLTATPGISLHNMGYYSVVTDNVLENPSTGIFVDSVESAIVANNVIRKPNNYGILVIDAAHQCLIDGNIVDWASGGASAIGIGFYDSTLPTKPGSDNCVVSDNILKGLPTGIQVNGNNTKIHDNQIVGATTAVENSRGVSSDFRANTGYKTEARGAATIASGATSVTVSHGLAATPTIVVLGATHAEVSDATFSATSTQITITVPSATSADRVVNWYAEV